MLSRPLLLLIVILLVGAAIGLAALGLIELPAPTTRVEKVIPSDRLPR
jgi:hypothetical protein